MPSFQTQCLTILLFALTNSNVISALPLVPRASESVSATHTQSDQGDTSLEDLGPSDKDGEDSDSQWTTYLIIGVVVCKSISRVFAPCGQGVLMAIVGLLCAMGGGFIWYRKRKLAKAAVAEAEASKLGFQNPGGAPQYVQQQQYVPQQQQYVAHEQGVVEQHDPRYSQAIPAQPAPGQ